MNLLVITSYFFLVPFFLSLRWGGWGGAAWSLPYLFVFLTSVFYHQSAEKHYCTIDMTAAYLVIVVNILFILKYWECKKNNCIIAMFAAMIGFLVYGYLNHVDRDDYYYLHSLWHVVVALGSAVLFV